ncbi:hypothetical protein U1Q18_004881 [Sarracenia purpurea var. burkii]
MPNQGVENQGRQLEMPKQSQRNQKSREDIEKIPENQNRDAEMSDPETKRCRNETSETKGAHQKTEVTREVAIMSERNEPTRVVVARRRTREEMRRIPNTS